MGDFIEYRSIGGGDKFLLDVGFGLELGTRRSGGH
jgi:hypothetical protein